MSDSLLVRRQKMAKELRRKEIEQYMHNIRGRLLVQSKITSSNTTLTDDHIEQMKRALEDDAYSNYSVEIFLVKLRQFSAESLCNSRLFTLFERAAMHVLKWGQNEGSNKYTHNLSKQLVLRAIQCPPNQTGRLPLQFCFSEVLEVLSNNDMEMLQIWKAMALIRSEYILKRSFLNFMSYIANLPSLIQDDTISYIIEVLANFTATIQGAQKVCLPIEDLFNIIERLAQIMKAFELGSDDLIMAMRIIENILKLHNFNAIAVMIISSSLVPCLLDVVKSMDDKDDNLVIVINIFNTISSGQDVITQRLISDHKEIIPMFAQLLPGFKSLPKFTSINVPSVKQWPPFSKKVLSVVLMFFCNIAACNASFLMLFSNIFTWFIAFSKYENPDAHAEVAIYLFNLVATSTEEQVEILFEKGLLQALNQVIREEYSIDAMVYGMRALTIAAKASKDFPKSNHAWCYSFENLQGLCERLGLIKYIEGLLLSKKMEVASYAEKCLNLLAIEH